jgi:calcineurin-like phosphoesterase family protein
LEACMTTWFTADFHFSHARIIELSNRPFKDVDEMDQTLIENFNSVVKPEDTVYALGDIALGKIATSLPLVGLLNGYKILSPGNHDRVFSGEKEKSIVRFTPEYLKVFQEIVGENIEINLGGHRLNLSHFPYQGDHTENDRHVDKRPKDNGLPLAHGHIHELRHISGRMFNVGVDVNDFYPVHEDVIKDWIKTL